VISLVVKKAGNGDSGEMEQKVVVPDTFFIGSSSSCDPWLKLDYTFLRNIDPSSGRDPAKK
ncbi:9185_t:CDS:2, partial [Funneliformis geosporum]